MNNNLIFGSMRICDYDYDDSYWISFFEYLYDSGVNTHHVSFEYESYKRYCKILKKYLSVNPEKKVNHIVKLAEPHFGINSFSETKFYNLIQKYLDDLNCNSIQIVQWMWRGLMKQEKQRISSFKKNIPRISDAFKKLKLNKKVEQIYCFPYTERFAEICLKLPFIDGFTVYRNPKENNFDQIIELCEKNSKDIITIRPFLAGTMFKESYNAKELLEYSLNSNSISKVILSVSNKEKFNQLS